MKTGSFLDDTRLSAVATKEEFKDCVTSLKAVSLTGFCEITKLSEGTT